MNIHWLQHVAFEGLGSIKSWAENRGYDLSCSRLFVDDVLPKQQNFDMLIVMGGPMGIYDEGDHPWLKREKEFIAKTIHAGKPVLGICLGAQLIADVLGARVFSNSEKEIGWFPLKKDTSCDNSLASLLPEEPMAFHWHGDTFHLPSESRLLYSSTACTNQAFLYREKVLGLQFHLETTPKSRQQLVDNCRDELVATAPWVQSENEILATDAHFDSTNRLMSDILDYLTKKAMGGQKG